VSLFTDPAPPRYTAFGLSIDSAISMPEFGAGRSVGPADLSFTFGELSPPPAPDDRPARVIVRTRDGVLLYWNRIGAFHVEGGTRVTIDPVSEVDERLLRLVLTGPVLGVVLLQRGFHVFHAAVVASGCGDAIAVVGRKGDGKSTMAAALYNAGYSMMSDDIMAVSMETGAATVLPGFPHAKLWAESAEALVDDPESLPTLGPGFDKRARSVNERFLGEPTPLASVVVLERATCVALRRLRGIEAVRALLPHWYGALFDGQLLPVFGVDRHFRETAKLAEFVAVHELGRPWSLDQLSDSVAAVDTLVHDTIASEEPQ